MHPALLPLFSPKIQGFLISMFALDPARLIADWKKPMQHAADFKAKGVDLIACTSVNDVFVLDAWAKASGARDTVTFLADGNGDFAKSIGLQMDGAPSGLGIRSKRYAMLVEDGVVKRRSMSRTRQEMRWKAARSAFSPICSALVGNPRCPLRFVMAARARPFCRT